MNFCREDQYIKEIPSPSGDYPECLSCPAHCDSCYINLTLDSGVECYFCKVGYKGWVSETGNLICLSECPRGSFEAPGENKCLPCSAGCLNCISILECFECDENTHILELSACVEECSPSYYLQLIPARECLPCHATCFQCYGPTQFNCTKCDFSIGLVLNQKASTCSPTSCPSGKFLHLDPLTLIATCIGIIYIYIYIECDISCSECKGRGNKNCSVCNSIYVEEKTEAGENKCVRCDRIRGYELNNEKSKCMEICGDGLQLGEYECDDGNSVSGDGCSADCKLENYYACGGGNETSPDNCVETLPPAAAIPKISNMNDVYVQFTEPVRISLLLNESVKTEIIGDLAEYKYDVDYVVTSEINITSGRYLEEGFSEKALIQFVIYLNMNSSLQGGEILMIYFSNKQFQDLNGNLLKTLDLKIPLKPFKYIDPGNLFF